jgi:signal transduction histidine kinase
MALIPVLAYLQFDWSGEASRAEAARMKEGLVSAIYAFSDDFERELSILSDILEPLELFDPSAAAGQGGQPDERRFGYIALGADNSLEAVKVRLEEAIGFWEENATDPGLMKGVWIACEAESGAQGGPSALEVERYEASLAAWVPVPASDVPDGVRRATQSYRVRRFDQTRPQPQEVGARGEQAQPPQQWASDPFTVLSSLSRTPARLLIVQLDEERVRRTLLPALVERHFGGHGVRYNVRIVERATGQTIYENFPAGPALAAREPDAKANFLSERFNPVIAMATGAQGWAAAGSIILSNPGVMTWVLRNRPDEVQRAARVNAYLDRGIWRIEVRHSGGSVDAYVARGRWLNLGGSLLLLLALGLGLLYLYRQYHRSRSVLRAQGDFVASVSHELKTPLAVIKAAAENLMEGVVSGEEQSRRYGTRMADEAERLLSLTDNVLRYSGLDGDPDSESAGRIRAGFEDVDMAECARLALRSIQHLADQAGALVEADLGTGPAMVRGDPGALTSLVRNLLTNALKHGLPESGDKTVRLELSLRSLANGRGMRRGRRRSGAAGSGAWVILSVRDHGKGIPKRYHERVFDPFFRIDSGSSGGIGLGLSLVRRIAEVHGGWVSLESQPGHGAVFTLGLPPLDPRGEEG